MRVDQFGFELPENLIALRPAEPRASDYQTVYTDRAGSVAAPTAGLYFTPGYRFRAADILATNFHLPRSTLFMLVSAFMGLQVMQAAYAEAVRAGYRFYFYGDACLLLGRP